MITREEIAEYYDVTDGYVDDVFGLMEKKGLYFVESISEPDLMYFASDFESDNKSWLDAFYSLKEIIDTQIDSRDSAEYAYNAEIITDEEYWRIIREIEEEEEYEEEDRMYREYAEEL